MKFIIGTVSYPSVEGLHMSQVHSGIWDTIEASSADNAARIFWHLHYNEKEPSYYGPLYKVTDYGFLRLFKYYIEYMEFDDPRYVW